MEEISSDMSDDTETRIIQFRSIRCNKCGKLPIIGARWKCDVCHGYDLCTTCYLGGKHNPGHSFMRFDAPECEGIKVTAKQGLQKKQRGGVLTGANAEGDIVKGVIFKTVYCDACGQREIMGTRWKCAVCFNYDLCTSCHRGGMHNLNHAFLRIDVPGGAAVKVPPRRGAVKADAAKFQGIYCNSCEQCPIAGTRWKCALCVEYDLCTGCYVGGKHNLDHMFLRVDLPSGDGEMVASRKGSSSLPVQNIQDKDVTFCGVNCSSCEMREIAGARWKCAQCIDCDLCTSCYMTNMHNFDHIFWRFDSPGREGLRVSPRKELATVDDRAVLQEAIKFSGINCNGCDDCDIVGTLWKCMVCPSYHLCTRCYTDDVHGLDHAFLLFGELSSEGAPVLPREASRNTHTGTSPVKEIVVCGDHQRKEEHARTPRDGTAGDHSARDELVAKLRELQDAIQCAICLEGRRNVAFLCGHSACADCAMNLSVCHMCRSTITKRITLY